MAIPAWIWITFSFAFGCSIGSFLNVVIYRLPRDKSLVRPGSSCPSCGKPIRFYDNIPLLSWVLLRARCRNCKSPISPRYFAVELLVGLIFTGMYLVYFHSGMVGGLGDFVGGGWFIYLLHIALLAAFVAASGIDLEHWVIPLSLCWFVTILGFVGSTVGPYIIEPRVVKTYKLLPMATPLTGSLAVGGMIGLAISLVLLLTGLLKRSYDQPEADKSAGASETTDDGQDVEPEYNDRREVCLELLFLLPIIICAIVAQKLLSGHGRLGQWWSGALEIPAVAGFLGSVWGYFIGCALVWGTRIFGTLGFGREAMGLGDVHLMGAAGTVIGPWYVVVAFFIAPFFGLAWACCQMFLKKIRQIPYGPFLSLGVLAVMIFHDWIRDRLLFWFSR